MLYLFFTLDSVVGMLPMALGVHGMAGASVPICAAKVRGMQGVIVRIRGRAQIHLDKLARHRRTEQSRPLIKTYNTRSVRKVNKLNFYLPSRILESPF